MTKFIDAKTAPWLQALGSKNSGAWVAIVVLLALGISMLAAHGDLSYILWASHYVADGRLNVYQAVLESAPDRIGGLTYPPLTYLFFGTLVWTGRFFGLFHPADWSGPVQLGSLDYLMVRLAYVPFLLLIAWTARRFALLLLEEPPPRHVDGTTVAGITAGASGLAELAPLLAVTSPILLFVGFIFGQFDILPASLLFLSAYLFAARRPFWAIQAAFVGVWLKNFPVVFLVMILPVALSAFGLRRVVLGLGVGLVGTAAWLVAFRSPGFSEGFLTFRHTEYEVLSLAGGMGLKISLSKMLLLCVFAISVALAAFQTRVGHSEKVFLIYSITLAALLGPRFWMPQYVAWLAPMLIVLALVGAQTRSALAPAWYLLLNGVYLLMTFVLWPSNVDTNMFYAVAKAGAPPLGSVLRLSGKESDLWTAFFILLSSIAAFSLARAIYPTWLRQLEPSGAYTPTRLVRLTTVGSIAMVMLFVLLHVLNGRLAFT